VAQDLEEELLLALEMVVQAALLNPDGVRDVDG
jgi:hypothetical protein